MSWCACDRWYSSRPQTIVVPPVGNGCPNGWDNHSQRVGRCVFHIFLPCLYVSQRNHHSGCIHYLHRFIHYFSCSLPACYVLVYAVYAIFKNKIFKYAFSCMIFSETSKFITPRRNISYTPVWLFYILNLP